MPELNFMVKPDPDVIITELEDEDAVVLHLGTKMYFTLNETGLRIWEMIDKGLTTDEIIETLTNEYDVSPKKAKESVHTLVQNLIKEKLVKVIHD